MPKINTLFALVGLNKILHKQCIEDSKKHNKDVTNFGKSKINLCNYINIVQPTLLYYLKMITGKELLDDIKHRTANKKLYKNAKLIHKNQIYKLSDKRANSPLTHATIYHATQKAIRKFDFSFDTTSVATNSWSWI